MLNRNTTLYGILALVLSNPVYAALDCTSHPTCESLGYSKSDTDNCADGGYLSCPYDTSYKKCVQVMTYANDPCYGFSLTSCPDNASCYKCETETATMYAFKACNEGYSVNESNTGCNINCTYADEEACESANANADCTDVNGCYEPTGCKTNYCKLDSTCYQVCDASTYKYYTGSSSLPSYASPDTSSSKCTGYYSGVSGGSCSGNSETRYSDYTCDSVHTKYSGGCGCDASVYKYYAPSYPKTGVDCCTGTRVLNGTAIGGGNNCKDFTCAYGYTKSGDECVAACTYTYTASQGAKSGSASCKRDGVTYYKEKCSGVKYSSCSGTFTRTCTDVTGSSWGTCSSSSCSVADGDAACKSAGYSHNGGHLVDGSACKGVHGSDTVAVYNSKCGQYACCHPY